MRLQSIGAAETVTGSGHYLELGGERLLIDCGLFQGGSEGAAGELERRNREPFPFEPAALSAVLLTHAHLDHVGRLPLLHARGFRGPIYCTPPTARLLETVLLDSARLQTDAYTQAIKLARRAGGAGREVLPPLYDEEDVYRVLTLLRPTLVYGETVTLGRVRARAERAGHILGSAFLVLDALEGRLVVSGDLGRRGGVGALQGGLQPTFSLPPEADAVLLETTYAGRHHRPFADTVSAFAAVLNAAIRRGGKILIPSFAIERSQLVLYTLKRLMDAGELPGVPVFLDSPMAQRAGRAYFEYSGELRPEVAAIIRAGGDPFAPASLHAVTAREESQRLNRYDGAAIVLAGNGMMTGGRILHHLRHGLPRPATTLVSVGYQAPGGLGGQLLAQAGPGLDGTGGAGMGGVVNVLGEAVPVRAHIAAVPGFSAHADQDDLLAWLEPSGRAQVWLVHGEPQAGRDFAALLASRGRRARPVPREGAVRLDGLELEGAEVSR